MIDYTNLYIKNLDPEVTSYDLFKRFRAYGKIISARVMKDTVTGVSKGYGFVSFTHMDEANDALQNMNGALLNSKNIIVTFHTHKKSLPSQQQQQQKQPKRQHQEYINLSPPTSASTTNTYNNNNMYPSQPSPPYHNHHHTTTTPPPYGFTPEQHHNIPAKSALPSHQNHNPWNETGIWMHKSPVVPHHAYHTSSMHIAVPPTTTTNTANASVLVSPNNSPPLIDLASSSPNLPVYYQKPQENDANTTITTSQIQIQKIRAAVASHLKDYQQKDLNDLVDLIQSLKKRDLSLCLFNPTFLKQKIDEAYEALYLFQNTPNNQQQVSSLSTTPSLVPHQVVDQTATNDFNSATAILNSLEGMTLNKKKRVFGDIFFPFVRATGVKHAPKVTIRLLDTVPLEELAFNMYDKQELTRKAQYAYSQLYSTNNNNNKNEY
ncbi:hypothetical protein HMPREF1544_11377 [Mucor circinelloides 1006PhL]|uniref:RRM domain-containing protein n=1 Tax=Mucor circinelloides f. circinelloides (strain 1006PhL) TaxID=1220926 RepID=S2IW60_MUCC1|nr:hypothetical protein HMPREF1544_11377 [Mucor circinelloides 1006PhL]